MTFDVDFGANPMTLTAEMGEVYDVSEGEADRLYQQGYVAGETAGYAKGEEAGYAKGETDGYAKGQAAGYESGKSEGYSEGEAAGYESGKAAEQAVTDSILDRTISGAYRNERVTRIGPYAFYSCMDLTAVDFPLATRIYLCAFYGCMGLTEADFPLVAIINRDTFYYCTNLKKLVLRNKTVCALENTVAFTSTPIAFGTGYIYVPDDLVDSYKAATNWSTFAGQIKPLSELEE